MTGYKRTYKAKITYCINSNHPDFAYLTDWFIGKIYEFEDTYRISTDYDKEDVIEYIKRDLSLVAGGGYDTRGIYGESFYINGKEVA